MRIPFLLLLLFCAVYGQAQAVHELKTDIFLPVFKTGHLSYEYCPKGRWSVEAGMFVTRTHQNIAIPHVGYDPNQYPQPDYKFELHDARQYTGIVQVAVRYYFTKRASASGVYGGVSLTRAFEIWRDTQYDQLYEERAGEPILLYKPYHFGIGVTTGYKWLLFKKRLVVEPGISADIDPRGDMYPGGMLSDSRVYIIPTIKVGYRIR
ncbi:MAG: DUF3575 domain-containing protein [Bacteroidetes bacterium]|nr:MAG: DUF3575 domain-containing protein [Bacteroidota bacterium]